MSMMPSGRMVVARRRGWIERSLSLAGLLGIAYALLQLRKRVASMEAAILDLRAAWEQAPGAPLSSQRGTPASSSRIGRSEAAVVRSDELYSQRRFEVAYEVLASLPEPAGAQVLWRRARVCEALAQAAKLREGVERCRESAAACDFLLEGHRHAKAALEADPKCAACHLWVGCMLEATSPLEGRRAEVEASSVIKAHFEEAAALDPSDPWARFYLGLWHYTVANVPWGTRKLAGPTPPHLSLRPSPLRPSPLRPSPLRPSPLLLSPLRPSRAPRDRRRAVRCMRVVARRSHAANHTSPLLLHAHPPSTHAHALPLSTRADAPVATRPHAPSRSVRAVRLVRSAQGCSSSRCRQRRSRRRPPSLRRRSALRLGSARATSSCSESATCSSASEGLRSTRCRRPWRGRGPSPPAPSPPAARRGWRARRASRPRARRRAQHSSACDLPTNRSEAEQDGRPRAHVVVPARSQLAASRDMSQQCLPLDCRMGAPCCGVPPRRCRPPSSPPTRA